MKTPWPQNLLEKIWQWSDEYLMRPSARMPTILSDNIEQAINALDQRKADILLNHYKNGQTLVQIAQKYSLTDGRISQIEHLALRKLAKAIFPLSPKSNT